MIFNAIGDSIVNGYGVGEKNSFVNVNIEKLDIKNFGVNGATTLDVLKRLDIIGNSNVALLYLGINDFLNGVSINEVEKNIVEIVKTLKNKSDKLILCSVHKICVGEFFGMYKAAIDSANEKILAYQNFIKVLCEEENLIFLDYYNLLNAEENYDDLFFDGIHPTEETHNIMKKYLLEKLGDFNG